MTPTITPCRDAVERVIAVSMQEEIELAKGDTPVAMLARFRIAAMSPLMRAIADEIDRGTDRNEVDLIAANFIASLASTTAGLTRSESRDSIDQDGAALLYDAYRVLTDPQWADAIKDSPSENISMPRRGETQ